MYKNGEASPAMITCRHRPICPQADICRGRAARVRVAAEAGQLVMPCLAGGPPLLAKSEFLTRLSTVGAQCCEFHCGEVNTCSSGYVPCSLAPTCLGIWLRLSIHSHPPLTCPDQHSDTLRGSSEAYIPGRNRCSFLAPPLAS